jgi:hypothetical protein
MMPNVQIDSSWSGPLTVAAIRTIDALSRPIIEN